VAPRVGRNGGLGLEGGVAEATPGTVVRVRVVDLTPASDHGGRHRRRGAAISEGSSGARGGHRSAGSGATRVGWGRGGAGGMGSPLIAARGCPVDGPGTVSTVRLRARRNRTVENRCKRARGQRALDGRDYAGATRGEDLSLRDRDGPVLLKCFADTRRIDGWLDSP
jgi:hypothetical protein